jgi:hypothetical protein
LVRAETKYIPRVNEPASKVARVLFGSQYKIFFPNRSVTRAERMLSLDTMEIIPLFEMETAGIERLAENDFSCETAVDPPLKIAP